MGTFSNQKVVKHSAQGDDFESLPETGSEKLHYVMDCFVNDYISLVIPTSQEQLMHVANAVINGIHEVFLSDTEDEEEYISLKKLQKQELQWNLGNEMLGFSILWHQKDNLVGSQET